MITKLSKQKERVETGIAQFGNDWPCVIIRGDNAFAYAVALSQAIKRLETIVNKTKIEDYVLIGQLENLKSLLEECYIK